MMRAITLWQPWAHAVIHLGKDIENRPRSLGYVGEIAIHAGLKIDRQEAFDRIWESAGRAIPMATIEPTRGRIIGVAEIVSWHRLADAQNQPWGFGNPWAFGPWCALLRDPRPIACPVLVRGYQGTWTVPSDVERAVREQLGRNA